MADKFVIGHEHCGVCGACLYQPGQLHRCPAPVRLDVLAVYLMETTKKPSRPRRGGQMSASTQGREDIENSVGSSDYIHAG